MDQRVVRGKSLSESQIIPLGRAKSVPTAVMQPAVDEPARRHAMPFKLFGILLLLPAIVVLSPPILITLLVIFVIWLVIVGSMAVTIVMSYLIGGSMWRRRHALRALDHQAIPAGQ
jgi:uncharacterized membrane protein YdbT with pleckstrin-like domain